MLTRRIYTTIGVIAIVLVILISALLFGYLSLRQSLPTNEGAVYVVGLQSSVQVHRDHWGVPHIVAQNDHDLFFAAGFVTAQDRLWQMDVFRRAANGQLAEVYGKRLLEADVLARTIGFHRIAKDILKQSSEESRQILQAYADGINALIEKKSRLPVEFALARYRPDPWQVEDSIAFQRLIAWHLSMAWHVDLVYGQLLEKFGEAMTLELWPAYPEYVPTILATSVFPIIQSVQEFLSSDSLMAGFLRLSRSGIGSNAWAISGQRSVTGKPILANDPHLAFSAPCLFYELHLKSPNFDVAGVSFPGLPGIVIGHNRAIAWGLTNGMIDDADFFVEQIDQADSSCYIFCGKSEKFREVDEIIQLKGEEPVKFTVRETRHGPVVSDINKSSKNSDKIVSLRWVGQDVSHELTGFLRLMRAQNWEDFTESLVYFGAPPQNFVYADTAGNIGCHLAGAIPIRNDNDGLFPVSGADDKHEWIGTIPLHNLPSVYNPSSGFIVSANNRIGGKGYPYYLSCYWEPPYRAQRITELLAGKELLTTKDFQDLQRDQKSLMAQEIVPYIIDVLQSQQLHKGEPLEQAYQLLKSWDFVEEPNSIPAAIFHNFYLSLVHNIFKDEMGGELFSQFIQVPNVPIRIVSRLLKKGSSLWFDDVRTTDVIEDMNTIILQSLREGLDSLASENGEIGSWRWGDLHTLTFSHPYSVIKSLGLFFDIGPYPVGGSGVTVNNTCYLFDKPFEPLLGPCTRQIVDLANIENALSIITTGQSGHFLSKHYKDQTPLWLNVEYHQLSMDSTIFKDAGWKHLTLIPKARQPRP